MERIGVDVYSIPPNPQTITSTFKLNTQRIGIESFRSDFCGMGWSFEIGMVETNPSQGKFIIHFVPNFLNLSALGHIVITVKDVLDHGIEGPSSARISETPHTGVRKEAFIRKSRTIGRYKVLHYDEPLVLAFSVELPDIVIPNYPLQVIPRIEAPARTPKLQELLRKSLEKDTDFHDVRFVLFSRRVRGHEVGDPKTLRANSELFAGANEYIDTRECPL